MKREHAVAFISGLIFALGLGLSGMAQPSKVVAFLDVAGNWDPSLAFVMLGAVGVHAAVLRGTRKKPPPEPEKIDARLLLGAAIFGVGWGLAGYCPGPAVVSVVTLSAPTLTFMAAMLLGMFIFTRLPPSSVALGSQTEIQQASSP